MRTKSFDGIEGATSSIMPSTASPSSADVEDDETTALFPRGGSGGAHARGNASSSGRRKDHPPRLSAYGALLVATCGIGGFLFGYDTGVISGALLYLRDDPIMARIEADRAEADFIEGAIVSGTTVGAALGAALGGLVSDRIGRRRAILLADVSFVAGSAALAFARSCADLIAGRVLVGVGVGLASMIVPVYIAEVSPKDLRAALVSVNVFMITSGQFVSYLVNYLLTFAGAGQSCWRYMLGVAALPAILQLAGMAALPESPRWLATRGRRDEAEHVFRKLRGGEGAAASREVAELFAEVASQERQADGEGVRGALGAHDAAPEDAAGRRALLASRTFRAELRLGVGLQVLQQVAGINTIMYFTPVILAAAGYRGRKALLASMGPALTNALGTGVGIWAIERYGRRRLIFSSLAAVTLSLIALGCLEAARAPPTVMVLAMVAYLASFAPGLGPVPWAVNGEIYPAHLRGFGNGAAALANWLSNAVVSLLFLPLEHTLPRGGVYFLGAACASAGACWLHFALPETKGMTFDEIQETFAAKIKV